jgi:hypothetical protein
MQQRVSAKGPADAGPTTDQSSLRRQRPPAAAKAYRLSCGIDERRARASRERFGGPAAAGCPRAPRATDPARGERGDRRHPRRPCPVTPAVHLLGRHYGCARGRHPLDREMQCELVQRTAPARHASRLL